MDPRGNLVFEVSDSRSKMRDGHVVFERNVPHMGRSECDTV